MSMEWWFGTGPGTVEVPTINENKFIPRSYVANYSQYNPYNQLLLEELKRRQNQALQAQQAQLGANLLNRGLMSSGLSTLQQAQLQQQNAQNLLNALEQQKAKEFITEQNKVWQNKLAQDRARQELQRMLFEAQFRANQINAANQESEGFLPGFLSTLGTIAGSFLGGPGGAAIGSAIGSGLRKLFGTNEQAPLLGPAY